MGFSYLFSISQCSYPLSLENNLTAVQSLDNHTFKFLNKSYEFEGEIDWNFIEYGKLWNYNLNYFNYLHQPGLTRNAGLSLIKDFIDQIDSLNSGLEPYPISLRGINWIFFLSKYNISNAEIDASLYAQYQILLDNLEYHILGNHLLENGCSLLFGAYYFKSATLLTVAVNIIDEQLDEQILADGGHYERSTMYHQIVLGRLIDCFNLIANNSIIFQNRTLKEKLKRKIAIMLGWSEQLTIGNDCMPLLNDSAKGIAPTLPKLKQYADRLNISFKHVVLRESGYRVYKNNLFTLICDVGQIGPDYIPGHAHSDTLSFILYINKEPVIIDPGISTYEDNYIRHRERSTRYHNTIMLQRTEQSEVWSVFRVGQRAKVNNIQENNDNLNDIKLIASHNGYERFGIVHTRIWEHEIDSRLLKITDLLIGNNGKAAEAFFHFTPSASLKVKQKKIITDKAYITFEFNKDIKLKEYECPKEYNSYTPAHKIVIPFCNKLITKVHFR